MRAKNKFKNFQNNVLPTGEKMVEGFSITLEMIDRHQSGVYQCTASNGVGDPVTVDMQLDVLCKFFFKKKKGKERKFYGKKF